MIKKNWFLKHKTTTILLGSLLLFSIINIIIGLIFGWNIVKDIFTFLSDQVLGIKWLNSLIGTILSAIFGQEFLAGRWGGSVQFFLYDTIKIIVLLCILIFVISYIQSFFPPERTKKILSKFKGIKGNIIGALLGTVTPFCSCSSIPIFIGFTRAGLSSGITFSFLISSPLVDLGALILLASIFGFKIAFAYVFIGLLLAIIGGIIIEKTGIGNNVKDFVTAGCNVEIAQENLSIRDRVIYAKEQVLSTFKKVWIYILIGVLIGSIIHNWIPAQWIQNVLGESNPFSVLIATILGAPMYADIFGTIPVAEALFYKGVEVGTILSFMMSVTALSVPSMVMLSRVVKPKLLITFIAVVVIGIIVIGYVFNMLNFLFI